MKQFLAKINYQIISKNFEETTSSRFSQGYYFPQAKNYGSAPTWAWGFLGFKTQITELDGHIEGTLRIYGVNLLELLVLSDEQLLPPCAWSSGQLKKHATVRRWIDGKKSEEL